MSTLGHRTPLLVRFWPKVDKSGGPRACWLWRGMRHREGYGVILAPGSKTSLRAHRVSWELANGPIPAGLLVCHHCDNPPCVNPAHLFLGTMRDNIRDAVSKGRVLVPVPGLGEKHLRSRLTEAAVREIRALYPSVSSDELGRRFGVSRACIYRVVQRQTWRHVA